jgi:hypothetical protein
MQTPVISAVTLYSLVEVEGRIVSVSTVQSLEEAACRRGSLLAENTLRLFLSPEDGDRRFLRNFYHTVRRYIPENSGNHSYRSENVESHK